MPYTKPFKELNKNNSNIAGGKGASLGEMINSGIPVPDGFVVLADTFEEFIKETDLIQEIDAILDDVDHRVVHTVDDASEKIQGLIKNAEMPQSIRDEILSSFETLDAEFVAVRSSATAEDGADHAWAGQLDSYLNITKDNVLEKVQHCWASLFTPRAIFYRFEKELNTTKISVAVVVQKMVNSELSGIAFSVHPVIEDRNQLIIEAGLGLGEAIVSGSITPDSYVVEKEPRKILDINVAEQTRGLFRKSDGGNEWKDLGEEGTKQVLTEEQILELSELIIKIENHYGFPCDIEWAYENSKFFIVQSRPITTLSFKEDSFPVKDNSNLINPEEYQRLFQVDGMPYLISDIFMGEYKKLKGLTIFHKGTWTSYLPKDSIEITLNEGLKIYSNAKKLNKYKNDFENYKSNSKKYFEKILSDSDINSDELQNFFETLSGFFVYYRKTEFFATDKAYEYSLQDTETAQNLEQLEGIKNPGREFLNGVFFGSSSYLSRLLNMVSQKTNKPIDYLMCLSKTELVDLLNNKEVSEDSIKERMELYVMQGNGENTNYLELNNAKQIANSFYKESHEFHTEIKGQIANKGYAKGIARVISSGYSNFDNLHTLFEKMQKGDILVSETTSPEIMPACAKASAIVTNQGGMMSHASIVSREMNIPCIVGTQNATELIKDGDMVEIDANNGIIKILKTNQPLEFESPELKDIDPENFRFYGMWKNDILSSAFWQNCLKQDLVKEIGLEINDLGSSSLMGGNFLVKNEVEDHIRCQIKEKISNKDKKFFDNIKKITDRICSDSFEFGDKIKDMAITKENTELIFNELKKINLLWYLGASHLVNGSEEMLAEQVVEEKFPADKVFEIIPQVITPLHEQQQDVKRLKKLVGDKTLSEVKSDVSLLKELQEHADKYYWIEILNFIGELLTVDRLYDQIIHSKDDGHEQDKVEELPKLSEDLEFRTYCMYVSGYVKQLTAEYFSMLSGKALPYFKQIAKNLDLEYREFTLLTPEEILRGLEDKISKEELKGRGIRRRDLQWFLISNPNGEPILIENKSDIKILADKMLPKTDTDLKTINGTSAYKGKVKGNVVIIMNTDEFHKMKPGDVLVTTMTTPDFVILMQQASAIVTDIGGLLCHAAIVSREIKTPCIIGTKIATQVLKDGDHVEVDANEGVVTIL